MFRFQNGDSQAIFPSYQVILGSLRGFGLAGLNKSIKFQLPVFQSIFKCGQVVPGL
jgi:hypothetical protein